MATILSIVGARPQFIKAALLSHGLRSKHTEYLIHTGQHYDDEMSDVFFKQLGIPHPDVNLNVGSGSHAEQTAAMLTKLEEVVKQYKPDWVLVYGDTNSTLAGSLVAAKLNIPVAHVEAGLRSFNRQMPEEINRIVTDHLSQLHLCPTPTAVQNLANEGILNSAVLTGDIMVDSVLHFLPIARIESNIYQKLELDPHAEYGVMTIHRPANADHPEVLTQIIEAASELQMPVFFPIHPRTAHSIDMFGININHPLKLISPLGYLDMLALVEGSSVLITDSGGLQKEAYVLKTPCITIRSETEWVETVESGWNRLVKPEISAIKDAVKLALNSTPTTHPDYYGDGKATQRIIEALDAAS